MQYQLAKRAAAEAVGTALLVATVVGSGIMGERLANGNIAIALLANTVATGAALLTLILTFGPISGAHFNPAVTLADAMENGTAWRDVPAYLCAQFTGGIAGTIVAHLMFGLPWYSLSTHVRHGRAQVFSEFVATFGLMSVIWGLFAPAFGGNSLRGRQLYRGCVLVHCLHIVRQSCRRLGPGASRIPSPEFVPSMFHRSFSRNSPELCAPQFCSAGWPPCTLTLIVRSRSTTNARPAHICHHLVIVGWQYANFTFRRATISLILGLSKRCSRTGHYLRCCAGEGFLPLTQRCPE